VRAFFLLLVAANLALFAWSNYLAPPDPSQDPRPLGRQIEPHKLRVLSPGEIAAVPAPKPKPAPEPPPPPCIEWGSFAALEAGRAEQALEPLALGARLARRQGEETAGWWVFIPPQGSRQGAQKKAGELKALGVEDYFIVQDEGPARWAVSLGVFRNEEAAKSRLEALRAKGVRTAQVGQRETAVAKIWLQVRNVDAALQTRIKEIAGGFPGTEVRDCP
jgi:hypothetical protein